MSGLLGTNFIVIVYLFLLTTFLLFLTTSFFLRLLVIVIQVNCINPTSLNHYPALQSCLTIIFIIILLFSLCKFRGSLCNTFSLFFRNDLFPTHIAITKVSDL